MAIPVVRLPGSSLMRRGCTCGCSMAALRMRVNGYRFSTAAFPALSKMRARPGCTGESGCLLVSTRKTKLDFMVPLLLTEPPDDPGNVCLDNVQNGFTCRSLA